MYILSLETSTKNFSLALSNDAKVLRFRNITTERILESSMTKAIDKLLVSCDLSLKKIDAIAVGLGPGSFTSLRVGISTIKAFAFALNKKVVGIGSLDVIASAVTKTQADEICVIVDARRGKVYAAIFDTMLKPKTEYLLTTIDDVLEKVQGTTLFVGDGLELYKDRIQKAYREHNAKTQSSCRAIFTLPKFWFPQSRQLAKLAFSRLKNDSYDDPEKLTPIYLYPQDCQVTKK